MFEKAQFTLVNEHFEAIFDKDISSAAISHQRLNAALALSITSDGLLTNIKCSIRILQNLTCIVSFMRDCCSAQKLSIQIEWLSYHAFRVAGGTCTIEILYR